MNTKSHRSLGRALFLSTLAKTKPANQFESNTWTAHVLPHGSIEELAPQLWHVTGILPGVVPPREMVLYRLPNSTLLIHSAIALNEAEMQKLEALGTPAILIVPNRIHRLDAAVYKQRYPQLTIVCPAAAKPYVEAVVAVDGTAEEVLPAYGIVCHQPAGVYEQELVYELPLLAGKALVFTDILFNLTPDYLQGTIPERGSLFGWLGASGFFGMTRFGRWFFLEDRATYQAWLTSLADGIPALRVISVAHGSPITDNCAQHLRQAAARLR
jgi:hypothetical protein